MVSSAQVQESSNNEEGYSYSENKMYNCCPLFLEEVAGDPSKQHSLKEILQRVKPEYPADLPEGIEMEELTFTKKCEQVEMLLNALLFSEEISLNPID